VRISENKVLNKIFLRGKGDIINDLRKLRNAGLRNLYPSSEMGGIWSTDEGNDKGNKHFCRET